VGFVRNFKKHRDHSGDGVWKPPILLYHSVHLKFQISKLKHYATCKNSAFK